MEQMVNSTLLALELGELQSFENLAVFPLRLPKNGGPDYITLKDALEAGTFVVSEVSVGGSVPELMVENKGDKAVLLLDGEELAGAKQNRVLNTTIFVAAKTSCKVPVSCTEQGRWAYNSAVFCESGNVMTPKVRKVHMASVSRNLASLRKYSSDQMHVWHSIAELHSDTGVRSSTGAMSAVYAAKKSNLEAYLRKFPAVDGQNGMLVFVRGRAVGLDVVSRPEAYNILHAKLLRSYAMEAILAGPGAGQGGLNAHGSGDRGEMPTGAKSGSEEDRGRRGWPFGRQKKGASGGGAPASAGSAKPDKTAARDFLRRAAGCEEKAYESVGEGWSYRYTGKDIVGSALAVESTVIHAAFFRTSVSEADNPRVDPMADFARRRRFRTT